MVPMPSLPPPVVREQRKSSELRPNGRGGYVTEETPFTAHTAPDGTVVFEDKAGDLTDLVMRQAGMEPYAARKLAFMDRTRDERMQIALANRSDNLRAALRRTPRELERLWREPGDPAGKRRLLFQLWDECAESGPPQVLATARAVRGTIVGFIQRRLPRGSRHGYRPAELAAFNRARTSRERFEPYDGTHPRPIPAGERAAPTGGHFPAGGARSVSPGPREVR
jgi:hypothetical protein